MTKLNLTLSLLFPAALMACGGSEVGGDDPLIDESAALALTSEDPSSDALGEDALAGMDADVDGNADEEVDASRTNEPGEHILSCDFGGVRRRIIERFDANGDGQLDETEREAVRAAMEGREGDRTGDRSGDRLGAHLLARDGMHHRRHVFGRLRWAFDVDNDGQLSDEERAELVAALRQRCEERRQRLLEEFDADGDGTLSEEERQAAIDARRAAFRERRAEMLEQFDTNGDGTLDDAERQAAREAFRQRVQEIRQRILAAFDANGDGELTGEEIDALKAAIRQRVAEGA